MDLIIVRENTEGFYSDRNMNTGIGEFCPEPGIGLSIRKITKNGSKRMHLKSLVHLKSLIKTQEQLMFMQSIKPMF